MDKTLIQIGTIYIGLSLVEQLWEQIRAIDGPIGPHDGGPGPIWTKVIAAGLAAGALNVLEKQTTSAPRVSGPVA